MPLKELKEFEREVKIEERMGSERGRGFLWRKLERI